MRKKRADFEKKVCNKDQRNENEKKSGERKGWSKDQEDEKERSIMKRKRDEVKIKGI